MSADRRFLPHNPRWALPMASVAIGLCIMGDSLLYSILPLEAARLAIPLSMVGVLLSVNRLIRLVSNTLLSNVYERIGPRLPFLLGTLAAVVTTTIYGVGRGLLVFFLARLVWGATWSALRQGGNQALWVFAQSERAKMAGVLGGGIHLGSTVAVLLGGYLWDRFGYHSTLIIIAALTALAVPLALLIPWDQRSQPRLRSYRLSAGDIKEVLSQPLWRSLLLVGLCDSSFEGVVVATTSLMLVQRIGPDPLIRLGIGAGSAVGAIMAVRFISRIVFGPLFGAVADRFGHTRSVITFTVILLILVFGAVQSTGWWLLALLCLVFFVSTGVGVSLSALVNGTALKLPRPHLFLGLHASAMDAGLASGPILAYGIGARVGLPFMYMAVTSILMLAVMNYWRTQRRAVPVGVACTTRPCPGPAGCDRDILP